MGRFSFAGRAPSYWPGNQVVWLGFSSVPGIVPGSRPSTVLGQRACSATARGQKGAAAEGIEPSPRQAGSPSKRRSPPFLQRSFSTHAQPTQGAELPEAIH